MVSDPYVSRREVILAFVTGLQATHSEELFDRLSWSAARRVRVRALAIGLEAVVDCFR
jgi:hypothetical protein